MPKASQQVSMVQMKTERAPCSSQVMCPLNTVDAGDNMYEYARVCVCLHHNKNIPDMADLIVAYTPGNMYYFNTGKEKEPSTTLVPSSIFCFELEVSVNFLAPT